MSCARSCAQRVPRTSRTASLTCSAPPLSMVACRLACARVSPAAISASVRRSRCSCSSRSRSRSRAARRTNRLHHLMFASPKSASALSQHLRRVDSSRSSRRQPLDAAALSRAPAGRPLEVRTAVRDAGRVAASARGRRAGWRLATRQPSLSTCAGSMRAARLAGSRFDAAALSRAPAGRPLDVRTAVRDAGRVAASARGRRAGWRLATRQPSLSTCAGSIRAARLAGSQPASRPTIVRTTAAIAIVAGSRSCRAGRATCARRATGRRWRRDRERRPSPPVAPRARARSAPRRRGRRRA